MGSYAQCWLDDMLVGTSKNDIDVDLISLFQPQDKIILSAPFSNLSKCLQHYQESLTEDPDLQLIYYSASASVIRDRLDVLGYDLETAKQAFMAWMAGELTQNEETLSNYLSSDSSARKIMEEHYRSTIYILSSITPQKWIDGLRQIRNEGLEPNEFGRYEGPHEDSLIGYMLSHDWYGFPGGDIFIPLRLSLEAANQSQNLIYDITDLVWGGYFDAEDNFVDYGLNLSAEEYSSKAKVVVLTEGSTDAWVLRQSLALLYPHLTDYFSFLDFESTGFGGGVGNLANAVKAFASSGIVNNVVALFDNDTAATAACRGLEKFTLPSNIAIRRLPESKFLVSYPTIGPSGEVNLNVNGTAASIELYLGADVLRLDNGSFAPVQWTGYDRGVGQYQGEVLEKSGIHNRFREKLSSARDVDGEEWDGIRAVLDVLLSAFREKNRSVICKRPSEYYAR